MPSTPEVIELLETYLNAAKTTGNFGHIAIAAVGYPNIGACDYGGDVALQLAQDDALKIMQAKLHRSIANCAPPEQDKKLDASYVCYNLRSGPLGFDFVVWLVSQEMVRVREKASAPLRVGFWKGRDGNISEDTKAWLRQVFWPALKLIGAVRDDRALFGRRSEIYVPCEIVKAYRRGEPVPRLSSSLEPVYPGCVSITLREVDYDQSRNSNLPEWLKFAQCLKDKGEQVVFVRDTAKASEPLNGFITCSLAARNLEARMALYQHAKANLFVSNGPWALAQFSAAPWLQFNLSERIYNGPHYEKAMGIKVGEQFPWCTPAQKMVHKPDTYENLVEAWEGLPV